MDKELIIKYNKFRDLCLLNSADALKTATFLRGKDLNHFILHLSVLALEEIGKIFIAWYQLRTENDWGKEVVKIPIDDHVKKLFWAIWGPSFTKEHITKEQIDEINNLATNLHSRRLDAIYTDLSDSIPSSKKISDDEAEIYLNLAKVRLDIAQTEGEKTIEIDQTQLEEINWFLEITNIPEKRDFIFGIVSQDKLIEFGDVKKWIEWLKDYFHNEAIELNQILDKELNRAKETPDNYIKQKWRITFKIVSPSHSIKENVLRSFFKNIDTIKLKRGSDNHSLIVDLYLDNRVSVNKLWAQGWTICRLFIASLNVGTNGFFYWNVPIDTEKYYDRIYDLENNKNLIVKLSPSLRLNWAEKKWVLYEKELAITFLIHKYFLSVFNKPEFAPINEYIKGLGMFAKTDVHLRLEPQVFYQFFIAFRDSLIINEGLPSDFDIVESGFYHLEYLITVKSQFENMMEIGLSLLEKDLKPTMPITLKEVVSMKHYCGLYFLTLAVRHDRGDKTIRLTKNEE